MNENRLAREAASAYAGISAENDVNDPRGYCSYRLMKESGVQSTLL